MTPASYRIARRSFLRGAAAAPLLLPLLRNIEARAQGNAAPLRFLVIRRPVGTNLDLWRPALNATSDSFTLPSLSAPFAPVQSRMVMIDGVNVVCASRSGGYAGTNTNEGQTVALMTGQPTLGVIGQQDHVAGGRSIDQIFLDQSPLLGGMSSPTRTRVGSLQLAGDVRSDRDEVAPRVLSYRDPLPNVTDISRARQPMMPITQPAATYQLLFGGVGAGGSAGPRPSVLDFAQRDLARMRKIVPASETAKLDTFADSLRQLGGALAAAAACTPPAPPPMFAETGMGATAALAPAGGSQLKGVDYFDANDPNNHPHQTLGRLQLSLIRAAFLCDFARVATFSWASASSWVYFPVNMGGVQLSMPTFGPALPHHPPSHTTDASVRAWLDQIELFYSQQTSEFLQELAATPDVDGNSMLDNTVVAYVSDVTRSYDHEGRNLPFLLFGGKNTGLRGGRFLKVTDGPLMTLPSGSSTQQATGNRPTNDVWLALAAIFRVDLPSLGAPTQFTGPLPGLLG